MKAAALRARVTRVARQRGGGGPRGTRPNAWSRLTVAELEFMISNEGQWPPGMAGELIDALIEDIPATYSRLSAEQLAYVAEHGKAPPGVREEDLR